MRERYTYVIQTRGRDDGWRPGPAGEGSSLRDPRSIARSLLERWVIDHPGRATGGVRLIVSAGGTEPEHVHVTVRVRVYAVGRHGPGARPVASAYLGYELEESTPSLRPSWLRHRTRRRPEQVGAYPAGRGAAA